MKNADLHIHTHFSDSSSSPQEVIDDTLKAGLGCIAITDHDTIEGVEPTRVIGAKYDIEVLAGVELSTELHGRDIHMLGYLFDEHDKEFLEEMEKVMDFRTERMQMMIKKLAELGVDDISFDEVAELARSKAIGRPHLAQVMVEKGHVGYIKEAFDKYLADDAPAYVSKLKLTPYDAIKMIKKAGGVSVLAHPMVTKVDEIIPSLAESGLDGIEVYYPNTSPTIIEFYEGLAKKYNLLMTGGSDAHGKIKKNTYIGRLDIPYNLVEKLKEKAGQS